MLKKHSVRILAALGFMAMLHLCSCSTIDPPEVIPSYGHVDNISVNTIYLSQGSASSAITCAWVYIDDQPVGAFDLPCTFPMIAATGTHKIIIVPGITADGASSTREKNPFYTFYDSTVNITQGAVTKFNFTAHYASNVDFVWMEDFDEPSPYVTSLTRDSNGTSKDTIKKIGAPYAFEGAYSGQVVLDSQSAIDAHMVWEAFTDTMTLPHDNSQVFMELNYNTNTDFEVGIVPCINGYDFYYNAGPQIGAYAVVAPSNGWQKIYIDITRGLQNTQASHFRLYFAMAKVPGPMPAVLKLDNIKVMHIKGS